MTITTTAANNNNFMIYQQEKEVTNLLTPPIDTTNHCNKQRKSLVTFDLPATPNNSEQEDSWQEKELLLSPCSTVTTLPTTIDICAQLVPDTMLVALFDRPNEMKGLVHHNKNFFLSLQQHLDTEWSRFENTLYCDRSKMADIEWMKRISKALQDVPSLLEKFKELVGYLGGDSHEEKEEDDDDTTFTGDSNYFSSVELYRIRNYPNRLTREYYPQFFINCEQFMNNSSLQLFEEFINTLSNTNQVELSNELWETKIYNQLENWPNLLEQLQEIVAYEIEDN